MKLSYRGVKYESQSPSLEIVEGEIGGIYRGQEWRIHRLKEAPRNKPRGRFTYRGVTYIK